MNPPKLASRLFAWFCGSANVEDLQGDLEESFLQNLKSRGLRKARFLYWKQVLSLMTSYAIRKRRRASRSASSPIAQLDMFQNYFKVAVRNLARNKYFAVINISGLAIGMSVSLLLIAMLSYISSYDNFHENQDHVYRVISDRRQGDREYVHASAPLLLAEKLAQRSGIREVVPIDASFNSEIKYENRELSFSGYFTEGSFLRTFTFPLIAGNAATALSKPNQVILTESAADKLFGTVDVLGRVIETAAYGELEVTGVLKDLPRNSHLAFDVLVSFETGNAMKPINSWGNFQDEYVYMLLEDKLSAGEVADYINGLGVYPTAEDVHVKFDMQALNDIAPGPELRNQIGPEWGLATFGIFLTLAILILVPAAFNYANISIARAIKRQKEIGLRKTLGGLRQQIFAQFVTESVVVSILALFMAYFIFVVVRQEFQSMLVDASGLDLSLTPRMFLCFVSFALMVGLLSGGAPALYFSRLNPIQAMKNQSTMKLLSGSRIRKALTIGQFVLSFSFIIGLVVLSKQYRYSLNFDLGFNQENILDVPLEDIPSERFDAKFSALASVTDISYSSDILGISAGNTWIHKPGTTDSAEVAQLFIDDHYIDNLGLTLIAGENFSRSDLIQERRIIVNEEFVKLHAPGPPADALGRVFIIDGVDLEIAGVVKNFNYTSIRVPIKAFLFRSNSDQFSYANLKIVSNDVSATLLEMETTWKTLGSDKKFIPKFFDEEIEESYDSYASVLKIIGFLGLLAISISCLGLLGMVVYTTETKTKEVGIRKVMGAATFSIVTLLSGEYLRLIMIASVIAIPISWLFFDMFLSNLQYYRVSITVLDVLISLVILLALGIGSISTQTWKIASANPADALKYE